MSIIYLLGSGRSGSTLLERVLNSSPEAFAVGELHSLWRDEPDETFCSCGALLARCAFWSEVLRDLSFSDADWAECRKQEQEVIRLPYIARLRFDIAAVRADRRVQDVLQMQSRILDSIQRRAGTRFLIDSSKVPPRAWILASLPGFSALHLHRKAVDVISSWRMPKWDSVRSRPMTKPSIVAAAVDWLKPEVAARQMRKQLPVQRLNYDDFATRPQESLERSIGKTHPTLTASIKWRDAFTVEPGEQYHSVMGNPDRYDVGPIQVRRREGNLSKLPLVERFAVRGLGQILDTVFP
jgi:hypothetical protein